MSVLTDDVAALLAKGREISARWDAAHAACLASDRRYRLAVEQWEESAGCWRRDRTEAGRQAHRAVAESRDARFAEWAAALADLEAVGAELRANSRAIRDLLIG